MGNYYSTPSSPTLRLMSYNVEWGFLVMPSDISGDACGHTIPHTKEAQEDHLHLISKNIGLINPDICFLQEIGSLDAMKFIANSLESMFNLTYAYYYSHETSGNQGVGLLINKSLDSSCKVEKIPNFYLERSLGITYTNGNQSYKFIGVHLKSLYDGKTEADTAKQLQEIGTVHDWCKDTDKVIICGDFNNVDGSPTTEQMVKYGYVDLSETSVYVPNITRDTKTEYFKHGSKPENGSKIDYMFASKDVEALSYHIIDVVRETIHQNDALRGETSDHLPILSIVKL